MKYMMTDVCMCTYSVDVLCRGILEIHIEEFFRIICGGSCVIEEDMIWGEEIGYRWGEDMIWGGLPVGICRGRICRPYCCIAVYV